MDMNTAYIGGLDDEINFFRRTAEWHVNVR